MSKERELELAAKYFEEGKELNGEGKYDASNTVLKKANEIYQKWKEWEKWIETNDCIDRNYAFLNKLNEAINYWQSTVKTGRKYLGEEHLEVARRLHCVGVCHYFAGDYDPAIEYYKKALFIRRKILGNEHKDVGSSNNNLGICYYSKDNYDLAIEHHQKTLEIWKKSLGAEHSFIASSLNNSGVCYEAKGDYDLAIRYHKEALSIRKKNLGNEHLKVAMSLNNIGVCYDFKGNYDLAIEYHQQALTIRKKNPDIKNARLFLSLMNLGVCYEFKGNYDLAIEYHQEALALRKKNLGEQHPDVADSLTNIGNCYYKKGEYDLATKYHQEALSTWQKSLGKEHPRIAISLKNLGNCYNVKGDYTLALNYRQKALTALIPSFHPTNIFQNPRIDSYSSGYELLSALKTKTQTFFDSYRLQTQKNKDLQAALSSIQLATELITNIRQSYKAEGSKHTLSEKAAKTYNLAIKIVLKTTKVYSQLPSIPQHAEFTNIPYTVQGCKTLAFDFTEQSKAILLLSSLKDSEAKSSSNIPLELLKKEKQLKIELNYLSKSIDTQEAKGEQKDEELLSKFQSQYFDYKQQYDELITQFETDYPEYYRLKYDVKTALVEEIQAYLSKSNEPITNHQSTIQLISYHITPKTIYIFTITSNDYQIYTIEKPSNFSELLEDFQTAFTLADVEEYMNTAGVLFDLLLKPVLDNTTESRKLIIIPHEQLSTLSFDALVDTRKLNAEIRTQIIRHPDFSVLPYLVKDYEISYHYSATMLLHSVARQEQKPPQEASFVGFAPVNFNGSEDTQLALRSRKGQTKVMRSNRAGEKALSKLPNTENEVKEVFQLFEAKELNAQAFLYASANKENLFENASNHKYVLIATHGYAQDENAGLSGIYLASKGEVSDTLKVSDTYNSYLLHTSEAYHLQLDADLVVLSSCSSGVGKLIAGEGMMAINRGFLYAGASNIIFTHFDIPDESSGELVKRLFTCILEGETYASALRKAKLEVIRQGLKTPEDWAGYALIGA